MVKPSQTRYNNVKSQTKNVSYQNNIKTQFYIHLELNIMHATNHP